MAEGRDATENAGASRLLFDLASMDLGAVHATREQIEQVNPHRGVMNMLDAIIWTSPDFTQGIARRQVKADEFWVSGHFPGKPMFPGVLMIETAAQLACYLFIVRKADRNMVAFLRIEHAAFRAPVVPGDLLLVLAKEVKVQRRRFVSDVQGVVGDKLCFDARISGITMENRTY